MTHPALALGSVAVITGAASGIGLAAARHLSRLGLRICLADLDGARLEGVRDHLILAGAALSSGKRTALLPIWQPQCKSGMPRVDFFVLA